MTHQNYHKFAGIIFLIVALVHLWRILTAMPVAFGTAFVPMWASWAAVIIAGYMSYAGLRRKM
jgi:hypothetical protein